MSFARSALATMQAQADAQIAAAQSDNPVLAFLLESRNNSILVKPVVLGLTNGTFYEVLAGLSIDDTVLVGEQDH